MVMNRYLSYLFLTCLIVACLGGPAPLYGAEAEALQILEADARHLLVELTLPAFSVEPMTQNRVLYHRLKIPGWGSWGGAGQPELPMLSLPVGLPAPGQPSLSILEYESEARAGFKLYPTPQLAQGGSPEKPEIVERFHLDPASYQVDTTYPGSLSEVAEYGFLGQQPLFQLRLYPFQYNPVRQELTVVRRMKVLVTFPAATLQPQAGHHPDPAAAKFQAMLKNVVVNYETLAGLKRGSAATLPPIGPQLTNTNATYIIVTHPDFYSAALNFAAYRSGQGQSVAVVKTTDLYNQYGGGVKSAAAIHAYLVNAYETWSIKPVYVLLLGDADQSAVLTQTDENGTITAIVGYDPNVATDFLPSFYELLLVFNQPAALDAGYAKLSKDNNGDFDDYPDVFIGRITARSVGEVEAVLAKVQAYEQAPPAGAWLNRAILVADDDEGSSFQADMEAIASILPAEVNLTKMYGYNPATTVQNEISQGALVVSYSGHGNSIGWGRWKQDPVDNIFRAGQVKDLTNAGKLPFLTVANCVNGWFANQEKSRVMAEEFLLRENKGAVAAWAPTNLTFPTVNTLIHQALHQAIFSDNQRILGEAATTARLVALAPGNTYLPLNLFEAFTYFGDPALRLATTDTHPEASFYSPTAPDLAGHLTKFVASDSKGSNLSYEWEFGDGSPKLKTTSATVNHIYVAPGTYLVTLTVSNAAGSASITLPIEILAAVTAPAASFVTTLADAGQPTLFTNTSLDGADGSENVTYLWDFGDGTSSTSGERYVSHTYEAGGVFTVRLTIKNSVGEHTFAETIKIEKRIFLPFNSK